MEAESTGSLRKMLHKISGQPESYSRKANLTFGRTLGAGSFGIVRYARDNKTGEDVAVKIILKKALKGDEQIVIDELQLLRSLSHPHIVGFRDWFESKDKFYIVTQLATGGELFDRIVQQGRFTEHDASVVIVQILEALSYLHKQDIVHRDIKPENVLYLSGAADSKVVLADFGIAKKLQNPDETLHSSAGSFGYAAPEVIIGTGHGKPCDIWSLGVVTYTILCGYSPFRAENVQDFISEVRHNNAVVFHADYWKSVSKDARRFIIKALQFNPADRATASQLLNDPWLVEVAAQHGSTDLLPNLRQNFDAKGKFRQAIELVKLSNRIRRLQELQDDGDDDPNEIDLFSEEGIVRGSSSGAGSGTEKEVSKSPLFSWGKLTRALNEATQESGSEKSDATDNSGKASSGSSAPGSASSASLSVERGSRSRKGSSATDDRSSLATSAFHQLVEAATKNKERVAEYREEP